MWLLAILILAIVIFGVIYSMRIYINVINTHLIQANWMNILKTNSQSMQLYYPKSQLKRQKRLYIKINDT